jgi:hypothetical protein
VPEEADAEGTVNVMFCSMVDLLKRLLFVNDPNSHRNVTSLCRYQCYRVQY